MNHCNRVWTLFQTERWVFWVFWEKGQQGGAGSCFTVLSFASLQAKGCFLKRLSDFPKWKPAFLSKLFHSRPVCVSCDHFISRQEKTTLVIAGLIGKHGSPGGTYVSCHVRWLHDSWLLQNHVIPKMGTVHAFHFPVVVLNSPPPPPAGFNYLDCEGGRRHTCSHLAVSQEGFFACVRVCLQTLFTPPAHRWPSASGALGVPQGSSQDGAMGLWQGTWAKNFSAGWGWNCLLKLEIKIMKPQDHRNPRIVDLKGTGEHLI